MSRTTVNIGLSLIVLIGTLSFISYPEEKKKKVVEPIILEPIGIDESIIEIVPKTPPIEPLIDALIMVESL